MGCETHIRALLAKAYMSFLALGFQEAIFSCCLLLWLPARLLPSPQTQVPLSPPKYQCLGQPYPELPTSANWEPGSSLASAWLSLAPPQA